MDVGPQLIALADPTRRRIFDLVRAAPSSVRELADRMPVSQPAVSQHLKVLGEAQLVAAEAQGRRRIYSVDRSGLAPLRSWIDGMWDDVLHAFERVAREESES